MTGDDILKGIYGILLAALSTIVGWLVSTLLSSRDRILKLEEGVVRVNEKVSNLEDSPHLTVEGVREVVEAALKRRDESWASRREDYDKLHTLELRAAIDEKMTSVIPKIVTEIRSQFQLELKPYTITERAPGK